MAYFLIRNILDSPFIMICLRSKAMEHVISESCYKRTILQMNIWSFSYNSFVKFHGKTILTQQHDCYIQFRVITRCVIKGM